uniref:G protein-coupled receptor n=2 Tax=Steinernema glaseri TaxID=37863 RepID=A0A1I7Z605_9BILA
MTKADLMRYYRFKFKLVLGIIDVVTLSPVDYCEYRPRNCRNADVEAGFQRNSLIATVMNAFLFDPQFPSIYNCSEFRATVVVPPLQLSEVFIGMVYIFLGSVYERKVYHVTTNIIRRRTITQNDTVPAGLLSKLGPKSIVSRPNLNQQSPLAYMLTTFLCVDLYVQTLRVFYIPCFIAMVLTPHLRRHSCYKLMICLAVVDILVVPLNAILSGIFLLLGVTYCSCPTFMYVIGCAALSLWTGSCAICSILALNRCIDLICPKVHKRLFEGCKIYFWLVGAFIYMAYFFLFTNPLLFSALYAAWFFDPFVGITDHPDVEVTLQVALVGTLAIIAALIYIAMQYFPTPYPVIVIGQLAWQAGHGCAAFVYFGMNNSIRRAVKRVFWGLLMGKSRSVVPTISRQT